MALFYIPVSQPLRVTLRDIKLNGIKSLYSLLQLTAQIKWGKYYTPTKKWP